MAEVGALHATLGLNSAQFEEGMKRAANSTKQFERASKDLDTGLAGMQRQFSQAANAIRGLVAALAVREIAQFAAQMIQSAAALGRLSDQAGVTVSEFQRLSFAFRDVGVSDQELAQSLGQFARNLSDLQRNTGPFLQFLRESAPALIEQFRAARDVNSALLVLSDAVAGLSDRQDRLRLLTAAGSETFGRFANQLGQGRRALQESQQGFTGLSDAAVAEAQRIEREFNALWRSITLGAQQAALAVIGFFSPTQLRTVEDVIREMRRVQGISDSARADTTRENARLRLIELEERLIRLLTERQERENRFLQPAPQPDNRLQDPSRFVAMQAELNMFLQLAGGARTFQQSLTDLTNTQAMFGSTAMTGLEGLNFAWMTHAQILEQAHVRIRQSYADTAEAQRQMAAITQQLNLRYEQLVGQTAQAVGKALVDVFPKSKAAAAAQALINTAVGVTQALSLPFPLNWIQAAAVFASGMAQVAAINKARPGGGTSLPAPGGGAGGGGGVDAGGGRRPMEIVVTGIDPGAIFSGQQMIDLIGAINSHVENGEVLISSKVMGTNR